MRQPLLDKRQVPKPMIWNKLISHDFPEIKRCHKMSEIVTPLVLFHVYGLIE